MQSALFHCFHLLRRSSLASVDNGAGMPHAATRRSGLPRDEAHHGLIHVLFDVTGRVLFRRASNFAHHHDQFSFRILIKELERLDEVRSDNRIAPDPDTRGLADAEARELPDGLVGQGATSGYHPYFALLIDSG